MIFQNIAERLRSITSILNNLKSFIKQVCQIKCAQNIKIAEISQIEEKLLTIKEKNQIDI